jgi:hypothetical protein
MIRLRDVGEPRRNPDNLRASLFPEEDPNTSVQAVSPNYIDTDRFGFFRRLAQRVSASLSTPAFSENRNCLTFLENQTTVAILFNVVNLLPVPSSHSRRIGILCRP